MPSPIPAIYRFWFSKIDPLLSLTGVYCNFFAPEFVLARINPSYHSPPSPETILLLDIGGAWFLGILVLQLGLLRARPDDVVVWRYLAAAKGVVDIVICGAVLRSLSARGRLGLGAWRSEDWGNFGIVAANAVLRMAFVLGIGVDGSEGPSMTKGV